ncbi:lipase-like protein [Trypanosoma vivax]|uniref:Lipase-like protein n=1 Tax=Trypanosoma vivax (strain Y486) TaxID=1055687 RepID=F9WR85_TRYVY|nr:lipase-like protein [Trypanosoma vivax]CCD20069.1 lipase-like protein [Trypanosoma vivax Y486]|eukprot:CCD20069.1 lipase-like protein [Trypanosoma vivax Y486]
MGLRLIVRLRSSASRACSWAYHVPHDCLWPCIVLVAESLQVCVMAYHTLLHARLRRALCMAVAIPLGGTACYLAHSLWVFYPEPAVALDTSSVARRPLFCDTETLMSFGRHCAHRYHEDGYVKGGDAAVREPQRACSAGYNALVGDLLLILRSMTAIQGTLEERQLVTPRAEDGGVSPAEFLLRIVLAISLDQGWFDIVEEARKMFELLVRERPVPPQANVASAVADLCSLSYELECCDSSVNVTMSQRQRVARAIDAFRPESSVRERCTIAAEIDVLPLADAGKTTRCLMLTRRSPGRRPQLIIVFIGTNSRRNWLTNLNCVPTQLPSSFGGRVRVHTGFLKLLESVAFAEAAMGFDQIILLGHSLGGALAQIAGLCLAEARKERRVTVLTVASPRVFVSQLGPVSRIARWIGVKSFHSCWEEEAELQLPENYRHIRAFMCADVIPRLPPSFLGYQHVGTPLPLHTGCPTRLSFLGWGLWSRLFHSAEMYRLVLERPVVAQLQRYVDVDETVVSTKHMSDEA